MLERVCIYARARTHNISLPLMHFQEGVVAKYEFIVYRYEEFWRGEHTMATMK